MPSVTVVVPLFNKRRFIARAIESIRAQTHRDFSAIIVDDGSTDASAEEAQAAFEGDPRFRLLKQANAGVSAARNAGLRAAATEWVAFLDADDAWAPEFLDSVLSVVAGCPDLTMVSTGYVQREARETIVNDWGLPEGQLSYDYDFFALWAAYGGPPVWSSAVAVRRSALLAVGGFPEGISMGEDILTWMALLPTGRRAFLATMLATSHGDDGASLTRAPSPRTIASHRKLVDALKSLRHPSARAVRGLVNTSHCYMLMRSGARSELVRHLLLHAAQVPPRTLAACFVFLAGLGRLLPSVPSPAAKA